MVAGAWTLAAAVVARFIPNWSGRIAFFVIAVGLPFWELPYGYLNFRKLCREEGRLNVYADIPPQKSVCVSYPFDASANTLHRFGFVRVEARNKTGEVTPFVSGALVANPQGTSKNLESDYCVTFVNNNRLPWDVVRHDYLVVLATSSAIVARHSVFDWRGMWWQKAASPVLGFGGTCRQDPVQQVMAALIAGSKKSP